MSNNASNSDNTSNNSSNKSFLTSLKEYKDFITIVIFFAGGFTWVYGIFATKNQLVRIKTDSDIQVQQLTCVFENNIQMLRGKLEEQYLLDLLEQNKMETKEIRRLTRQVKKQIKIGKKADEDLSELNDKLRDLEEQRNDFKKKRDKFKDSMEVALNKLTTNTCSKSKSANQANHNQLTSL